MGEKNSVIMSITFAVKNSSRAMHTKAAFKPFTCQTPTISLLFVHSLEQVLQRGHGVLIHNTMFFYLPATPLDEFVPYTSSAALKKESVPTNTAFKYLPYLCTKYSRISRFLLLPSINKLSHCCNNYG